MKRSFLLKKKGIYYPLPSFENFSVQFYMLIKNCSPRKFDVENHKYHHCSSVVVDISEQKNYSKIVAKSVENNH